MFYKKKKQDQSDEFKNFKDLAVLPGANTREWWREKENKYPIIAKLARRYLPIPASSAPSERIFSKYGIVWEKRRGNLKPETANNILFLHETRK